MSTELSTITQETAGFELLQRAAKMLAASTLVPKDFQGNTANCAIGINIAKRLGADPFMVIQNIDVIHGRPSFRATFLIAMVNASGRFTPIQFRMEGEGQSRSCVAHCTIRDTGEAVEGPQVSMAMAKAEGWSSKTGSKWTTLPELMLRYRAVAFFARIYAPDVTLGMHTSEEVRDMEVRERPAKGREVTAPALFSSPVNSAPPTAGPIAEFFTRVDAAKLDYVRVMAILRDNQITTAEFPADITADEASEALSLWATLTQVYAAGGAK